MADFDSIEEAKETGLTFSADEMRLMLCPARALSTTCLGSACAAWRTGKVSLTTRYEPDEEDRRNYNIKPGQDVVMQGFDCSRAVFYCGLAGRP